MTAAASRPSPFRGAVLLSAAGAAVLWLAGCAQVPGAPAGTAADPATAPASAVVTAADPKLQRLPDSAPQAPAVPPAAAAPAAAAAAKGAVDALRPEVKVDLDDAAARADLWARVRRGFAMPDLEGDLVRQHEQWYATRPDYVKRMTERGGRYLFHVVEELERRGMPLELALLPFIESAFNPQAMSVAKASGMWQFIPSTGRDFDLKQNVFRDDRRDVLASTRAALDYLERLHAEFQDWHLALAAYNWGEGSVRRAIARNQRAGQPTGYEDLRMPAETRSYVPKLQAVKNIVLKPDAFGLALPALANHPYFVSVPIERDIDVALAARFAGLKVEEFKQLNPQMNQPLIVAAGTPQVLLPYDNAEVFVRNLAQHRGPLASWTAWVAKTTLRPAEAARQLGVAESELREINRIPPRMLVKAGSTLLVPRSDERHHDVAEHIADNATMALAPDLPPLQRVSVKAGRKGESVAAVARRYGVSAAQVAQWNKVAANGRFRGGQSVVLMLRREAATAVATAPAEPAAAQAAGNARAARPAKATRTAAAAKPKAALRVASSSGGGKAQKPARSDRSRQAQASAKSHVRVAQN